MSVARGIIQSCTLESPWIWRFVYLQSAFSTGKMPASATYRSLVFGNGAAVADMPRTASVLSPNARGSAHGATEETWTSQRTHTCLGSISAMDTSPEGDAMYSLWRLPAATIGQGSWPLHGGRCRT